MTDVSPSGSQDGHPRIGSPGAPGVSLRFLVPSLCQAVPGTRTKQPPGVDSQPDHQRAASGHAKKTQDGAAGQLGLLGYTSGTRGHWSKT